jgi:hypothetical protein
MHINEKRFVTMMIAHDLNFLVRSTGGGATCVLKQTHHNAQIIAVRAAQAGS